MERLFAGELVETEGLSAADFTPQLLTARRLDWQLQALEQLEAEGAEGEVAE